MNSQRKQYIVNLLATFASQGFTAGSILLLTPILLSNLGTELFSLYGIILNLILIFAIFDIGFNTGLLRRLIHEQAQASTLISTCFYFFLAISPLVFLAIWGFINIGWLFAANQSLPISSALLAVLLAAWVLLNMQAALFDVVLQSLNKIFVGKVIRIIKTIVEFGLIWWASYQQNIIWMIACLLVTNLLYVFAMYLIAKRAIPFRIFFPTAFISSCKLHINYSIWYGLSAIAGVLVYNAQTVLMGTQLSTSSIAIILVVAKFYEVVKVGLANFTVIIFHGIGWSVATGQWHTIFVQYKKTIFRIGLLVVLASIFLLTVGEYLFKIWSGFTDAAALQVYHYYTLLIMALVIEHISIVYLSALKLNKIPTIVSIVQGLLGLLLSYWLMQTYQLIGAIWGSLIALCCTSFFFNPIYLILHLRKKLQS